MQLFAQQPFVGWSLPEVRTPDFYEKQCLEHSICPREFAQHQNRSTERHLIELIWHCRDRSLLSRWLHDPCAEITVAVYGRSAIELDRLYLGWSRICTTYRLLMFDAQIDAFSIQRDRELLR